LITFDNNQRKFIVHSNEIKLFANNEIYKPFYKSFAQVVFGKKMSNLLNHDGAGPPEVRGPMQPYRLHRLKTGPDTRFLTKITLISKLTKI